MSGAECRGERRRKGMREVVVSQEYSRRAYRYATPSAINISGEGGPAVGRVERHSGESPEPGIYNETKKGLSPSSFRVVLFVFSSRPPRPLCSFVSPPFPRLPSALGCYTQARAAWLSADVEVHFIPTFNKTSPGPFGALLKIEDAICLAGLCRRRTCSK